MNNRHKTRDRLKNVLIALLLCSAVFLGWQSRLFGNDPMSLSELTHIFSGLSEPAEQSSTEQETTLEAARPSSIVVTEAQSAHYGIRYDTKELNMLYDKTVQIFAEALGSAETPTRVGTEEWQQALASPGVYYEYATPIPLTLLDGWYGTQLDGWDNGSTKRLCVIYLDGKNRLYFQQSQTGDFYAADTAPNVKHLTEPYPTNGALFAFELPRFTGISDPNALILNGTDSHPVLSAENPLANDETLSAVLSALGFSERTLHEYYEGDDRVIVDTAFTLRLSPNGTVVYRRTQTDGAGAVTVDGNDAVERARAALASALAPYCGSAQLSFRAIDQGDDLYRIDFCYTALGGCIYVGDDGYAASVTVDGHGIVEMTLHFRAYTVTNELRTMLPELQAAAAAGGAFMLSYRDAGQSPLEPEWIAAPD